MELKIIVLAFVADSDFEVWATVVACVVSVSAFEIVILQPQAENDATIIAQNITAKNFFILILLKFILSL